MDTKPLRIAIIGGGVSGLSLAYYLQKFGSRATQQIEVTIFERKATLGGNAETVWVDLGVVVNREGPNCLIGAGPTLGLMMLTWPPIITFVPF